MSRLRKVFKMPDLLPYKDDRNALARAADLMAILAAEVQEEIAKERSAHRVLGGEVQER